MKRAKNGWRKHRFTECHLSNIDSHRTVSLTANSTNLGPIDQVYVPILLRLSSCGSDCVGFGLYQHNYSWNTVAVRLQMIEIVWWKCHSYTHWLSGLDYLLLHIISTIFITRSMCFRAAIRPLSNKYWNSDQSSDSNPPITSTNSGVNLNGLCSKPKFFGEMLRMKPKSMWMRCPSECNRIFPLCLWNGECDLKLIPQNAYREGHKPIFHLQQIRYQTIRRTTLHEILLRHFEVFRLGTAVFVDEIFAQTFIGILFDLMQRHRIQNRFNESTVVWETNDFVWSHP